MKTLKLLNWLAAAFFAFAPVSNAQEKQIRPFSQEYTAINSDFKEVSGNLVIEKLKVETARSDALRKDGTQVLGLTISSKTDYVDIENTQVDLIVPQGFQKKDVKVWPSRRVINPNTPIMYRAANDTKRIPLDNDFNFLTHIVSDLRKYEQRILGSAGKKLQGKRGDLKILEDALASNGEIIIPLDYEPRECVEVGYRIEYTLPAGANPRISAIVSSRSSRDKEHFFKVVAPFFTREEAIAWNKEGEKNQDTQAKSLESYLPKSGEILLPIPDNRIRKVSLEKSSNHVLEGYVLAGGGRICGEAYLDSDRMNPLDRDRMKPPINWALFDRGHIAQFIALELKLGNSEPETKILFKNLREAVSETANSKQKGIRVFYNTPVLVSPSSQEGVREFYGANIIVIIEWGNSQFNEFGYFEFNDSINRYKNNRGLKELAEDNRVYKK